MNDLFVRERADKEIRILAQLLEAKTELQEQALGRTGASKRMCLAEIKGIDRALGIVKKEMEKMIDIGKHLQDAFNDGYRQAMQDRWIPVSERLPEEGRYLVTTVYGEVKESEFDLKKWWQIDNSTISLEWKEEPIKVVAWQPLPEPYKEVANEKNN